MKLLLFAQLNRDLDVVELLFHELDERTGDFRFVAVLPACARTVCRHAGRGVSGRCTRMWKPICTRRGGWIGEPLGYPDHWRGNGRTSYNFVQIWKRF